MRTAILALAATLAAAAGCKRAATAELPGGEAVPAEARELFQQQCATCHGEGGKGDGPASRGLEPKPRNYTDATWQAAVTDAQIRAVILKGGAAAGKSANMPPYGYLEARPGVVDGLVAIVRGFGHTPAQ